MSPVRVLTGITTSGTPHLGNYVGAVRPTVRASRLPNTESFLFLADYHALIKPGDPARVQRSTPTSRPARTRTPASRWVSTATPS